MFMEWAPIAVAAAGSIAGGYLGVKIAVTRLQTQMETALEEIRSLRDSRHEHANLIQDHEGRIVALERWRDKP